MLGWNRRVLCHSYDVKTDVKTEMYIRRVRSSHSHKTVWIRYLFQINCGYLQLHSTTSGELPVSSIASTPMFVYYNIREPGSNANDGIPGK